MEKKSHLVIVGAGPTGASLAIRLARENYKVVLIEREKFPRQKLCGEFISPECFRHFQELGVAKEMLAAGGERIAETVFYAPNGKSVGVPSEWFNEKENALSLSRAEMDFRLLEKAKTIGVDVLENCAVVDLVQEKDKIRAVKIRAENAEAKEITADLFVDATGRARVLGKLAEKNISRKGAKSQSFEIQNPKAKIQNRFVGFKAHLKNADLAKGVCEIYFFRGGYGGLSFVENNLANFCFLIRADVVREFNSDVEQIIENLIFRNERAVATLKRAAPIHDWLAVSVDGFGARDLNPATNLFAVGDAGAFIDPFTGSGMLMALESAEILARAVAENSSLESLAENYKLEHARRFQKRLFICSLMRHAAFSPTMTKGLISVLSLGNFPRRMLAQATRRLGAAE